MCLYIYMYIYIKVYIYRCTLVSYIYEISSYSKINKCKYLKLRANLIQPLAFPNGVLREELLATVPTESHRLFGMKPPLIVVLFSVLLLLSLVDRCALVSYTYIYMYVYIHMYVYIYKYIHTYIYTCIYPYLIIHECINMYAYMSLHISYTTCL
jgi:hypothetical protein